MMRLKEVALSNASTEAKIAGLAVLLDKELLRLSEIVLNTKKLQGPQGEQGLQGPKGEQGDRGFDGTNGKDGSDGKDGKDGHEGKDGVGVQDAKIDFDGSLVITLTNGREINAGDVVPEGVADKIKVIKSGGGNSQTVLDAIEEIQATIATYGTIATQNADAVAITGGTIDNTVIGGTTPAAGTFTTLIGGKDQANYGQITGGATTKAVEFVTLGTDTNIAAVIKSKGTGAIDLAAGSRGVNISNGGTVTAITRTSAGSGYGTAPTVTISAPTTAGGVQATATVAVSAGAITTFTITNAGSGYVEQPTVSLSGGGGSGAAAYAVVGSGTVVRSIGSQVSFFVPSGEILRLADGTSAACYVNLQSSATTVQGYGGGAGANVGYQWIAKGVSGHGFFTSGTVGNQQFNIAHTASAVNYVQVTGAATGSNPTISVQGSDAGRGLAITSKGAANIGFYSGGSAYLQLLINGANNAVNYMQVTGTAAGAPPVLSVGGTDTNIDLTLTPKGTGNVRFGTYTASMALTVQGYIEIKDSGGTVRKLAVIA